MGSIDRTLFDVKVLWAAFVSVGEAALALREARDALVVAQGNSLAAATLCVLYEGTHALVREQGAELVAMRGAGDPEVRTYVEHVLACLHADRATVPPTDETRHA